MKNLRNRAVIQAFFFYVLLGSSSCQILVRDSAQTPENGEIKHFDEVRYREITGNLEKVAPGLPMGEFSKTLGLAAVPFDEIYPDEMEFGMRIYHFRGFGLYVSYEKKGSGLHVDSLFEPELYIDGLSREERMKFHSLARGRYMRERARQKEASATSSP